MVQKAGRKQSIRELIFFLLVAATLYLRLMYRVSFFPPYFEGEEAHAIDTAKATWDYAAYTHSWWEAIKGSAPEYNKGYVWGLVPFYHHFGYDVRLITYILPVFYSAFVAAFFTLYRKAYPRAHLASFLLVALFSVLCLCLRRYKWHSMTYLTAISVYVCFLPLYSGGAARRVRLFSILGTSLFLISCFFYFGGLIYAPPLVALIVAHSSKEQRRRELLWGVALLAALVPLAVATLSFDDVWRLRIHESVALTVQFFSHYGLLHRWLSVRDYFFTLLLSFPFLVLFVVGFCVSVRRMRQGDVFAQVTVVLFLSIWCFELLIEGVSNPDQLNWSMIPTLGLLVAGADACLDWIRARHRYGMAVGLCLMAAAGWNEVWRYPAMNRGADQPHVQDRNTRVQGALVLRMISEDRTNAVQYYLPDPSVPEAEGGFDYNVSLKRVEYAEALKRVMFFTSDEDLRQKLLAQAKGKMAVAYLSVGFPASDAEDTLQRPLLGQRPAIIHPYEDTYHIPFLVRRYRMLPAQVPALSLDGMVLWLKASAGTQGPGILRVWVDQTGLGHDATLVPGSQPPKVVNDQINGLPVVRFQGANALNLPAGLMQDARCGQIIAVARIASSPDQLNVLWNLGTGWGSTYKDALHFEDFGNPDTNAVSVETAEQISQYYVYDTSIDADGLLTYRYDGLKLLTKHTGKPQFQQFPAIGGYGNGSFYGDIAEIILYRKTLAPAEQAAVYAYLAKKYQLPVVMRNLGESAGAAVR